jgi:hypothetical protein
MFQFCSIENAGWAGALESASGTRRRIPGNKRRVGDLVHRTGPCSPAKGTPVYREHEEEAFYLAKWTILGLGAFGVSLLICAMFI